MVLNSENREVRRFRLCRRPRARIFNDRRCLRPSKQANELDSGAADSSHHFNNRGHRVLHFRHLLRTMGFDRQYSSTIHGDNMDAIRISKAESILFCTQHVYTEFHHVSWFIANKTVAVDTWTPTRSKRLIFIKSRGKIEFLRDGMIFMGV